MTHFYTNVKQEIMDFVGHCQDLTNSVHPLNPISCLTNDSYATFTSTIEHLDIFIDYLSNDTSDLSLEYDRILSIVFNCSDLVNYVNTYQNFFIEYAIDDYLLLDEHIHSIYEKVLRILHDLHHLSSINSELYKFERDLRSYLPSIYSTQITSSLTKTITSTIIEQTSRLFSSTYNSLLIDDENDDNDCIMTSSFLFSTCPLPISSDRQENNNDQSRSLLQLDKINLRTPVLTHSQVTPAFQFDLIDFEQIEDDLKEKNYWIEIEREFFANIISIWSTRDRNLQTINPCSSEIFWRIITNFKYSDVNLKCEFILVIQWVFCLLSIQALNRDWDLFFSKTLVNIIISNRWGLINSSANVHLSIVGYNLNQMFLRLIRITSVLQYMKILADQSMYLTAFFSNIISIDIDNLTRRIEGTFQLLFVWIKQNADTFTNSNVLERTLIICQSDHPQLSISIRMLLDTLRQLNNCEQSIKSTDKLSRSADIIISETMTRFHERIQFNATKHFNDILPMTGSEWRTISQQNSCMIIACDKLLKSIFSQLECLNIDQIFEIYENILSAFVQAWLNILRQRKYRFNDEMIHLLQKDYEYIQAFLTMNISDSKIVHLLNRASALQQLSNIIDSLKDGDKIGPDTSYSQLPDHDKWLDTRQSSSGLYEFFQYACCCHRRNRVTTDPI